MTQNLYSMFGTNKSTEQSGIEVCFGSNKETDPVFVIARAGGHNTEYLQALSRISLSDVKYRTLSLDEDRKAIIELYFRNVVKKWRNVKDEHGKDMSFTKDNFVKLFVDLPDLWEHVRSIANDFSKFHDAVVEETAKK